MKTRSASGKLKAVNYVEEHDNDAEPLEEDSASVAAEEDEDESEGERYMSTVKRRRTSYNTSATSTPDRAPAAAKKVNGKDIHYRGRNVGKLSKLLEMPVDIFCEISTHLEPLDLLHLARSTRGFNRMLMSKDSRLIWRTARRSCNGLPDCPPDLSEPQYARLLFERDCHACLSPRAMKVDWVTRSRLCHRCRSSYIVKGTQLLKSVPGLTEDLLEYIPCRYQDNVYRRCLRRLEYFYITGVEVMVKKYHRTPVKERADFLKYHKELIYIILKHVQEIQEWHFSDRVNKSREANVLINRRELQIHTKLTKLGYTNADFPRYSEDQEWSQIVHQPRDVTPRIWKTIRPKLETIIAQVKKQREECDRRVRKNKRRSELSPYLTNMLDVRGKKDLRFLTLVENALEIPVVEDVLSEGDYSVEITSERWETVIDRIERGLDEYADQREKQLAQLVLQARRMEDQPNSKRSVEEDSEVVDVDSDTAIGCLTLPSVFFSCTLCNDIYRYPHLFVHSHGWVSKWENKYLNFHESPIAILLSKSLGGDEQVISAMAAGNSFQCLRCDERISPPRSWEELVKHFVSEWKWYDAFMTPLTPHHAFCRGGPWTVKNTHGSDYENEGRPVAVILSAEETSEQREKVNDFAEGPRGYSCRICNRHPLVPFTYGMARTRPEIEVHFQQVHEIDTPTKEHMMGPGL